MDIHLGEWNGVQFLVDSPTPVITDVVEDTESDRPIPFVVSEDESGDGHLGTDQPPTLIEEIRFFVDKMLFDRPALVAAGAFLAGAAFGLFVLGWWLFPVQYTNIHPNHMDAADQELYVDAVSDLFAYQGDTARVQGLLGYWRGDAVACQMALRTNDWAESMRLQTTAYIVNNGQGCEIFWVSDE